MNREEGNSGEKLEVVTNEEGSSKKDERFEKKEKLGTTFFAGLLTGLMISFAILVVCIAMKGKSSTVPKDNASDYSQENKDRMEFIVEKENFLMELMNNYYYYDIDMDKLEEAICDGLVLALGDKYAQYYTKEEYKIFAEQNSGTFYGIGVMVSQDLDTKVITVTEPIEGGPSKAAGILAGDIITEVNGEDIRQKTLEEVVALIKGEKGTAVKVGIERNGEKLVYEIIRDKVNTPSVSYKLKEDNIAYIYISSFEENTPNQFIEAIEQAKREHAKGIVFDLRNNPGGNLTSVVEMMDYIIDEGILVYIEYKNGYRENFNATKTHSLDMPMVCLVNQYSASAAELFTGAIQYHNKGKVVGVQTYGKGVVQSLTPLSDGTAIKFTTSKYFIGEGFNIDGTGITPDVKVELDRSSVDENGVIQEEMDNQLQAAIEEVKKMIGQ